MDEVICDECGWTGMLTDLKDKHDKSGVMVCPKCGSDEIDDIEP